MINDKEKPAYYKQFYAVYKINDEFKQLGKISHYGLSKENEVMILKEINY